MTAAAHEHLVGHRFPDGAYTIDREEHTRLCEYVGAPPLPDDEAHPAYGHIATHVGKGVTFTEFIELLEAPLDAGFLFAGGSIEYLEPLRVERPYAVRGGISAIEPREGRKTGPFEIVTTQIELVDEETGRVVCRSTESTIVPRKERS
jgi:hypothetical protein